MPVLTDPQRLQLLKLLQEQPQLSQRDLAQALVQVPMPCGVGACDICRVGTRLGEQRTCVDGPVFDLLAFLPR